MSEEGNEKSMKPVISSNSMSRFEFTKILGFRIMQLSRDIHQEVEPEIQAEEEILSGRLNWFIRRQLPGNTYEDCDIRFLTIPSDIRKKLTRN